MKKHLFITSILALIVVSMLSFLGYRADPNAHKNAFNRKLLANKILPLHQTTVKEQLFALCGYTSSHFFFSNDNPRKLILLDRNLTKETSLVIPMPVDPLLLTGFDFVVDSPLVTLYSRNMSLVLSYRMGDLHLHIVKLGTPLFSRVVPMTFNSIALRAFDSSRQIQFFQKADSKTGKIIEKNKLLADKGDAGYSTDGFLRYDDFTRHLLYIESYRNQFYCMDSNLNLVYKSKTIDTVHTNFIATRNTAKENKQGSIMSAAPILTVNKWNCVDRGKLYNISTLKGDNEKNADFRDNSVVDVYQIKDGAYTGSFYVPDFQGKKVQSIYVKNDTLVALYPLGIATYQIP